MNLLSRKREIGLVLRLCLFIRFELFRNRQWVIKSIHNVIQLSLFFGCGVIVFYETCNIHRLKTQLSGAKSIGRNIILASVVVRFKCFKMSRKVDDDDILP